MHYGQIQRAGSTRKAKLRKKGRSNTSQTVLARERLPNRRASETFNFEVDGLRYRDRLAFCRRPHRRNFCWQSQGSSQSDTNARDAALAASLALQQHGCTLAVLRNALLRDTRGRAATPLGVALDLLTEQRTGSAP
jgi:hypothetical protein